MRISPKMIRWSRSRSSGVARAASSPSRLSRTRREPGPDASATAAKASATSARVSGAPPSAAATAGRPRTFSTRGSEAENTRPLR